MSKLDGFEQRELVGDAYWKDPRWKKVQELREQNKHIEANSLAHHALTLYDHNHILPPMMFCLILAQAYLTFVGAK